MQYDWELLPRLAEQIERRMRREAHQDLDRLLGFLAQQSGGDLTLRKMRCAQTASVCVRGARRGGGPSGLLLDQHVEFLRRMSRLRSWRGVRAGMRRYIGELMDRVEPARQNRMERVVARMVKDLRENPAAERSLAQYAADLDLSTGHLSRAFAALAGASFRVLRRRERVKFAAQLLRTSESKVGAIARQVGLQSASQFIAEFKREMGVTPAQFRRGRTRRAWRQSNNSVP